MSLFGNTYKDRIVLITGHTGFKGSWLCLWLKHLGANVIGYSLPPPTNPNHFDLLTNDHRDASSPLHPFAPSHPHPFVSIIGDIRDEKKLKETFQTYKPEIVFHLAAQPLVRYSYKNPVETFETNIMGTINVFEACRQTESVRAIVNITSDKCYENPPPPPFTKGGLGGFSDENGEWGGYRENDPMGGYDPYSASKGCAELVTSSYRNLFFNPSHSLRFSDSPPQILLASARAGNVIGGGDWAEDRLIPDIMGAAGKNEKAIIRNPEATRPWQHVLEPLSGYLMLGQKLLEGEKEFADGWNFGPDDRSNVSVLKIIEGIRQEWERVEYEVRTDTNNPHEARLLKLDCTKARLKLHWRPVWDIRKTIEVTTKWYKEFYENGKILSQKDLDEYVEDALKKNLAWAK